MGKSPLVRTLVLVASFAISAPLVGCDDGITVGGDVGTNPNSGNGACAYNADGDPAGSWTHPTLGPISIELSQETCLNNAQNGYQWFPNGIAAGQADCDDSDASVYPGAPEINDGKDNNCNGQVDEGTGNGNPNGSGVDYDGDGWTPDYGYSNSGDCNDNDRWTYPGAPELADGRDNDCDGQIDEGIGNPGNGGNDCSNGGEDLTFSISGLAVTYGDVCLYGWIESYVSWGVLGCGNNTRAHSVTLDCVPPGRDFEYNWGMMTVSTGDAPDPDGFGYNDYAVVENASGGYEVHGINTVRSDGSPVSVTIGRNYQDSGYNFFGSTPY